MRFADHNTLSVQKGRLWRLDGPFKSSSCPPRALYIRPFHIVDVSERFDIDCYKASSNQSTSFFQRGNVR